MHLDDALDKLEAIHAQVLRSETYRGFRALPTALSGAIALCAAVLQSRFAPAADATAFAHWWMGVAVLASMVGASDLVLHWVRGGADARWRSLQVLRQIGAPFGIGALFTFALLQVGGEAVTLLPGVWAACFGAAIVSARPFLPERISAAAGFYLVAAVALLVRDLRAPVPEPLGMGITFGVGQLLAAFALRRGREVDDGS